MTFSNDDTQPRSPFQNQLPPGQPSPDLLEPEEGGGPGCLLWGLVGIFSIVIAIVLVTLAGFSGWNAGLRVAQVNATVTHDAYIFIQCERIGADIRNGMSSDLIQRRFEDLQQQTPAPACLELYAPMATAYLMDNQPTVTLSPTLEPTLPVERTAEVTIEASLAPSDDSEFDLAGLLADAQTDVSLAQWTRAIDTLDAIIALDPNYERSKVSQLLFQSLTTQANSFYQTGRLAEAIVLTDRAEVFGDIGGLNYERFIASIYLDAQRYVDINFVQSTRLLRQIVFDQNLPNYQGGTVARLLFSQYVKYAEALSLGGDPCNAVIQYQNAIDLTVSVPQAGGDSSLPGKRDAAQTACTQLTLQPGLATVDPNATMDPNAPPPTATIAPVGVGQ